MEHKSNKENQITLYSYSPYLTPKITKIQATNVGNGIFEIDRGYGKISGRLDVLISDGEYSLTPLEAIQAIINRQKRIIEQEQETLNKAEKDLFENTL